jgi:hypothetical protein
MTSSSCKTEQSDTIFDEKIGKVKGKIVAEVRVKKQERDKNFSINTL